MRIQLTNRRSDESGAIAVMAGLLATTLALMAGFAVDFGMAYNSKRQLQTAADAASLAAAAVYSKYPGACDPTFVAAHEAEARAAAVQYANSNRPGQTMTWSTPTCLPSGILEAHVSSSASTGSAFGGLAGIGPDISTSRDAAATVDVPPTTGNMRPLAICVGDLPPGPYGTDTSVKQVYYPGGGHAPPPSCDVPSSPGQWWLTDCPEDHVGSASLLKVQIHDGCQDPISVVANQSTATTPAALTALLRQACPTTGSPIPHDPDCLGLNPGAIDQGQLSDSWKYLIDNSIGISMPVFCAPSACSGTTFSSDQKNVPVYRLAGVKICGYHFGKQNQTSVKYAPTSGPALTAPCTAAASTALLADDSTDVYLNVVFTQVLVEGGTGGIGGCALGASCDTGQRRVLLSQ